MINRKSRFIVSFLFMIILVFRIYGQSNSTFKPFFFVQVTDPQFGMFESNKGFTKETELYEKAVNAINRLNPEFVVITGDFVNDKTNRAQVNEFKRITFLINPKIPVYYCPGNHDTGQSPEKADIEQFVSDYGYDKFSFTDKECLFIGLNSCLIKSKTPGMEQNQFDWLSSVLAENKRPEHIILFCHYPFFITSFDEPETYSNIQSDLRNKYFSLFRKYNVEAVFAGHLHNNSEAKFENIEMVTTSAVGKPLGKAPSGIRIVKVYKSRIESVYCPLDSIPENFKLK
jgi:serine/threonine-protein phosphatase CPPED1